LLPRASLPWQVAQLLANRRSPMAMALGLRARSGTAVATKPANSGAALARARACSSSNWETLDHLR
jgi:hypothetical protein